MATSAAESRELPTGGNSSSGASTGLWLFGGILAAVVLGIGAGLVPARLRLFYLFPVVHSLILAGILQSWRRQLTAAPSPRWAPLWISTLVVISVAIGAWQAAVTWQNAGGGKIQPGAAIARQMVAQMPPEAGEFDSKDRQELLDELNSSVAHRNFRGWLAARAANARSPWPELLWGSECLVAVITVLIWNGRTTFHATSSSTGKTGT